MAIHDRFAFVGLSKPRYKRFEGLELEVKLTEADSDPWCGIQIIDLETRTCVDWLRIDGAVAEFYVAGPTMSYCDRARHARGVIFDNAASTRQKIWANSIDRHSPERVLPHPKTDKQPVFSICRL